MSVPRDGISERVAALEEGSKHILATLEKMDARLECMNKRMEQRPSIVAWIGAVCAILGLTVGPAGAVYWRLIDKVESTEKQQIADHMSIEHLRRDHGSARP